jgi:hypothetical protein
VGKGINSLAVQSYPAHRYGADLQGLALSATKTPRENTYVQREIFLGHCEDLLSFDGSG